MIRPEYPHPTPATPAERLATVLARVRYVESIDTNKRAIRHPVYPHRDVALLVAEMDRLGARANEVQAELSHMHATFHAECGERDHGVWCGSRWVALRAERDKWEHIATALQGAIEDKANHYAHLGATAIDEATRDYLPAFAASLRALLADEVAP